MASLENVDIWIGTALGPLKGASFKLLSDVSYQLPIQDGSSKLERSNEIKVMCWDHESEENLFLGHKNGRMSCFSTVSGEYVAGCCIRGIKEPGVPVGLEKHKKTLITCLDTGALSFWPEDEDKLEVSVGNHVSCMRGNPHVALQVATGGQENDLKVWDGQNSDKPVFQAKNVCPDNLQLRVPVWVTQLCFVPPVHSSSLVAVGTGHHHVRLYDIRAQKRPVYSTEFGDSPITAMDVVPNGRDVIIGNSKGQLAKVDLRTGKVVNTFKDGKGCIKCVKCHLEDPLLVSCGLDRFLRVYHLESRELLQRKYMKLEMNCLLLTSTTRKGKSDKERDSTAEGLKQDGSAEEDSEDDVWEQLETVTEPSLTKKRLSSSRAVKSKPSTSSKMRKITTKNNS